MAAYKFSCTNAGYTLDHRPESSFPIGEGIAIRDGSLYWTVTGVLLSSE